MLKRLAMVALVGAAFNGYREEAGSADGTAGEGAKATKKPKAEQVTVKMQDDREVVFVGKRKLLKEPIVVGDKPAVRLDFRNGETRTFVIPDRLMDRFAQHGAEQKLGDETAGVEDVDDMVIGVDELISRLETGNWGVERAASNGLAGTSVLLKALVELTGKTVEDVKTFLSGKTQAEKMALRNSAKVKPIVDRIEAEKAAKGANVDTEALLGELGG